MKNNRHFLVMVAFALCISPTTAGAVFPGGQNLRQTQTWKDYMNCITYSRKFYYKLVAEALEEKLNAPQGLSPSDVQNLRVDIASVQQAAGNGHVIDADPKVPRRWMGWLTNDDLSKLGNLDAQNRVKNLHACTDALKSTMSHSPSK